MGRFLLYAPNGKHGVHTLNCKARYDKDNQPIYPNGWMILSDEQIEGLKNKTLAWENGELVPYTVTDEELQAKQDAFERETLFKELQSLNLWFNDIYDAQIKQAERCIRLGVPYDNKYGTVEELDNLAVEKATRIRQLRILLNEE